MALYRDTELSPAVLLRTALSCNTRPDARESGEGRAARLSAACLGTAEGSACCRLGHTAVVCGVRAELSVLEAPLSEPRGAVLPNLELPALCHARWHGGPPSDRAQTDSDRLLTALRASGAVDERRLCLPLSGEEEEEGESGGSVGVWVLYCDLVCLCDDGNVWEAAVLAMSAALQDTRLPPASFDRSRNQLHVQSVPRGQWQGVPGLDGARLPVAVVLGVCEGGEEDGVRVLVDPCAVEEESGSQQLLTVWSRGELVQLVKPGGRPVSQQQLSRCVDMARSRAELHRKLLDQPDRPETQS